MEIAGSAQPGSSEGVVNHDDLTGSNCIKAFAYAHTAHPMSTRTKERVTGARAHLSRVRRMRGDGEEDPRHASELQR